MVERRRTPKDPEDTKGGVRGTHGLGDTPRGRKHVRPVATQGGTASRTGASGKSGGATRADIERAGQEELEHEEPAVEATQVKSSPCTCEVLAGTTSASVPAAKERPVVPGAAVSVSE